MDIKVNIVCLIILLSIASCSKKTDDNVNPAGTNDDIKSLVLLRNGYEYYAVDGETGKLKWHAEHGKIIMSDKKFLTQSSSFHPESKIDKWSDTTEFYKRASTYETLSVIDPSNGQKIRNIKIRTLRPSFKLDDGCDGDCGLHGQWSRLIAANNSIAIMQMEQAGYNIYNVILYGINLQTGDILWSFPTSSRYAEEKISVTDDKLYVGCLEKSYVLNVNTGQKLQEFAIGHVNIPPVDGKFYIHSEEKHIISVANAGTGAVEWQLPNVGSEPIISDGAISFGTWSPSLQLVTVDSHMGNFKWSFPTPNHSGVVEPIPVVNKVIYTIAGFREPDRNTCTLFALEAGTGKKIWETVLPKAYYSTYNRPKVSKAGILYFLSRGNKKLIAIRTITGETLWELDYESKTYESEFQDVELFDQGQLDL